MARAITAAAVTTSTAIREDSTGTGSRSSMTYPPKTVPTDHLPRAFETRCQRRETRWTSLLSLPTDLAGRLAQGSPRCQRRLLISRRNSCVANPTSTTRRRQQELSGQTAEREEKSAANHPPCEDPGGHAAPIGRDFSLRESFRKLVCGKFWTGSQPRTGSPDRDGMEAHCCVRRSWRLENSNRSHSACCFDPQV